MLGAAFVLAGCGGASKTSSPDVRQLAGDGFAFQVPAEWRVERSARSLGARGHSQLVSVTIFRLARPVTPALRAKAAAELDRVARQLAAQEGGRVERERTETVAGREARVYDIARSAGNERIAFVLVGRREYELYCRGTGPACETLFSSFTLSG